tara:strand:- start:13895 stop:15076 length:1182 start_codon:yes stop_codon:yes gene_type:complete
MTKKIPYSKQNISIEDINSVIKVLKSEYLTTGPLVKKFENKITKFVKSNYCVSANSATSALHIACKAIGLGPGDNLWTSPNSFVASSNCALYCGANIDFIDIELKNYNIDIDLLEKKLIIAKKLNKLPKIVIPVLFGGHPHDMKRLKELSNKFKFKIIEDASHAFGAEYFGNKIGNCKYSDITIFSLHPVKIFTTGEGGIATTNNKNYYERMNLFKSHGITRDKNKFKFNNKESTYYEQHELGFNYRLTDIQCALGISQLKKIKKFINSRIKIKKFYDKELKKFPFILPNQKKGIKSSWHLYPVMINKNKTNKKKFQLLNYMRKKNIYVNTHYIPIHIQPYYRKLGFKKNDFKNSIYFYEKELSLPIYPSLKKTDLRYIIKVIDKFFKIKNLS